jgi:hypothetical protein
MEARHRDYVLRVHQAWGVLIQYFPDVLESVRACSPAYMNRWQGSLWDVGDGGKFDSDGDSSADRRVAQDTYGFRFAGDVIQD